VNSFKDFATVVAKAAPKAIVILAAVAYFDRTNIVADVAEKAISLIKQFVSFFGA
jgi:hypothetical protein